MGDLNRGANDFQRALNLHVEFLITVSIDIVISIDEGSIYCMLVMVIFWVMHNSCSYKDYQTQGFHIRAFPFPRPEGMQIHNRFFSRPLQRVM